MPAPNSHDAGKQGRNLGPALTTQVALAHRLDWSSVSKTLQNFVDSTCILSLLSKQQAHDDIHDDQGPLEDACGSGARDDIQDEDEDEDEDEDWDSWDVGFEERQRHDEESLQLALARLRSHFLDRLSEVLARTKDPPEAVKQISSAYLEEFGSDPSSQRVQIRVSKNEGFSDQDEDYLKTLSACLEQVVRGGTVSIE
jgi:hypothetical protein